MYRVLLVDDEIWSLEGIRKLFEWEKHGFNVIAQTTDASIAFELICSAKPDVVITDIRMPEISGLELLQMAREKGVQSEFVIISGFAEFEYAQEALRYGAFDYQLKPIDRSDAGLLLKKLKLCLDKKSIPVNRNVLNELVSGLPNPLETLLARGFIPQGKYWQVVAVNGEYGKGSRELLPLLAPINHFHLQVDEEKWLILVNGATTLEKDVMAVMAGWDGHEERSIGLSSVSHDLSHLGRLVKEADMAAAHPFIDEQPAIVQFTAIGNLRMESITRKLEKLVMLQNYTEICTVIDDIPEFFKTNNLGIYQVTCLWNQLAVVIRKRIEVDALVTTIDFLDYEEIVCRFQSLSALCAYIKQLLQEVCAPVGGKAVKQPSYNGNFIALLEYVNNNYTGELSLSELAERFFLNMSYCSELFKKVAGYTFSDYVTKLRMEAAAELIESGKYTADRVSHMTGYNDYYYFSKIFKKFHGVTPIQFTERMGQALLTGSH
ncbi:response regulator transcription factor [Paenibacillus agricola]|uniref:Response regulator n=1 Tax=Paenibacillus agricola TaxID=2716264 RepID=A0ABX0JF96_9BACL|nr:response regulator [Paenibacillus agricola]NHN32889.1 response regulator [Paenibacillus agricola]